MRAHALALLHPPDRQSLPPRSPRHPTPTPWMVVRQSWRRQPSASPSRRAQPPPRVNAGQRARAASSTAGSTASREGSSRPQARSSQASTRGLSPPQTSRRVVVGVPRRAAALGSGSRAPACRMPRRRPCPCARTSTCAGARRATAPRPPPRSSSAPARPPRAGRPWRPRGRSSTKQERTARPNRARPPLAPSLPGRSRRTRGERLERRGSRGGLSARIGKRR
mmetsp:Transcript_37901/g.64952  ORF Transcript_37901/g.64952 Transcript_37901/m.64952 type:complete len:223 (-) Transcript_37901:245-913(-)